MQRRHTNDPPPRPLNPGLDTNEYWLIADLQIACDADGISPLALPGAILVVLVPIGVPAATLLLLWMNRDQLMEHGTGLQRGCTPHPRDAR